MKVRQTILGVGTRLACVAGHARLAFVESRPVVQLIYTLRFLAAYAMTGGRLAPTRWWWLPAALGTWLCATMCAYLLDGVMDVVEDRLNGSTRPIAAGALPRRVAAAISLLCAALAMTGAAWLGGAFTVMVPAVLLLGYAYSSPPLRLKRWSSGSGAVVLAAGLMTFAAGGSWAGGLPRSPGLVILALAMSLWMGLVGAVAKDFSDVYGDAAAGRRTLAVVRGVSSTARRLAVNAIAVAAVFLALAIRFAPILTWPAITVLIGAAGVAATSLRQPAAEGSEAPGATPAGAAAGNSDRPAPAGRRRPYRVFMVTQYAAHLAVLATAMAA